MGRSLALSGHFRHDSAMLKIGFGIALAAPSVHDVLERLRAVTQHATDVTGLCHSVNLALEKRLLNFNL